MGNWATFQDQWAIDKRDQTKHSTDSIVHDLCGNVCQKSYDDVPPNPASIINNDNDVNGAVTALNHNKNNNHLNYRYQKVYQDGTDKIGYISNAYFANQIKDKEPVLKEQFIYKQNQHWHNNTMGSNVSRNTAKGLSGRRTQSSGECAMQPIVTNQTECILVLIRRFGKWMC